MARFQYVAKDMKGKIKKGTVEAASEKTLTADLLGTACIWWRRRT